MQPAFSTRIPDGLLAAMRLGGEKPHQGLPGRNPALYQGPTVCNSTTALGLRGQAELNRVGSCSTGKERDTESGNDYFGARYYASSMGRFLSPDWSSNPDPVPYADPANPQSLNLYTYVRNNALGNIDLDGHSDCGQDGVMYSSSLEGVRTSVQTWQAQTAPCLDLSSALADLLFQRGQTHAASTNSNGNFSINHVPNFVSKHYGVTTPCTSSATDVMNYVETNFSSFGNYSRWAGEESVFFSQPSGIGVGSTIPISVGTFGIFQTLSVNVAAMNSQSMTFTTNPGHLLYPASITFSATQRSQGSINFNINLGGTVAKGFEFFLGGGAFEDAQWNHFLERIGSYCKQQ